MARNTTEIEITKMKSDLKNVRRDITEIKDSIHTVQAHVTELRNMFITQNEKYITYTAFNDYRDGFKKSLDEKLERIESDTREAKIENNQSFKEIRATISRTLYKAIGIIGTTSAGLIGILTYLTK